MHKTRQQILREVNKKIETSNVVLNFFYTCFLYSFYFFIIYDLSGIFFFSKNVKNAIRYILLFDLYIETRDIKYLHMSKYFRKILIKNFDEKSKFNFMKAEKNFWPYWSFEKNLKKRMLKNEAFSIDEILQNLSMKSADTCIYMTILQNYKTIDDRFIELIHNLQSLSDLTDDIEDLSEDLDNDTPNTLVLLLVGKERYEKIKEYPFFLIKKHVITSELDRLSHFFYDNIKTSNIPFPTNFFVNFWLKIKMRQYKKAKKKLMKIYENEYLFS